MKNKNFSSYPYIPNSVPAVKKEMLDSVGAASTEDLFADIPQRLRLQGRLNLPPPLLSEFELVKHVEDLLAKNRTSREFLNFLGAGCYQHYVPAVCDEVNCRGEFLTAYAGEPYDDHGRFQALFEYQSMMGELLNMDVVNVPTYDGLQASATALRMAARITGRNSVLLPKNINPDKLSKIKDYLKPDIRIVMFDYEPTTGIVDLKNLELMITNQIAAIFLEIPNFFGGIDIHADQIVKLAHQSGVLCVVNVEPISLGVLTPPADFGADIVCGDIQSLGMHMSFGGGNAGFIATQDDEKFVMEYPSRLFGIAPTIVEGEYGFGDVAYERTSFAKREGGKEWVGTAAALWGITAGVYLALMGPQGMVDVGKAIVQRTRYAMDEISKIPGISVLFSQTPHFREFVINFDASGKTVAQINQELLEHGIFGGKDISADFQEIGQSAIYCVTEIHSQDDIDSLVNQLGEVTR